MKIIAIITGSKGVCPGGLTVLLIPLMMAAKQPILYCTFLSTGKQLDVIKKQRLVKMILKRPCQVIQTQSF